MRFPALRLAREALDAGGAAPIRLNAANEIAVHAFLKGRIGFTQIVELVETLIDSQPQQAVTSVDDVLAIDASARQTAEGLIARFHG